VGIAIAILFVLLIIGLVSAAQSKRGKPFRDGN